LTFALATKRSNRSLLNESDNDGQACATVTHQTKPFFFPFLFKLFVERQKQERESETQADPHIRIHDYVSSFPCNVYG
jgi:hypothetical protein